ncbi:MAG: SulP family inorganic anion transporter [Cyanobacteria bacterium P01_H01_bin.105]
MTFLFSKKNTWPIRVPTFIQELQPETVFSSFVAGSITGLIGVIRAISYAALIFSGSLAVHLNVGVGIAIFSSAAISIVVALMSSLPGMIATPLAAPTAVLAILAAQIANTLTADGANSTDLLITVVAAIALGSLITGASLWLLGILQGGNALQFIPYPVVGGFMAATGWLLVRGAIQVMTGEPLTFSHLAWFIELEPMAHWGAGLIIAIVLLVMTKRYQSSLILPGILLAATSLFYGAIWQSHLPLTTIRAQGWLLGPFPDGNLWQPLSRASLGQVRWDAIAQHSNILGLLIFVSLLSLVLTNGGIELALGQDLDLNRELRAVGIANIIAGLGSTMVGNQALPSTLLVHKMGASSRLTGLFKAVPCVIVLFLGPAFLAYFPKPILGSLLLFLGLELLWQWLYKIWFRLAWHDYLTIVITLVVINRWGFIVGIGIGFGITAVQFLYHCTQTSSISSRELANSNHLQADIGSDIAVSDVWLEKAQGKIEWIDLQGFLFFGNAASLFQQVRSRILHPSKGQTPDFLVLNFQSVLGLDASAVLSFSKLMKLAKDRQLTLVFNQVSKPLQQQLNRGQGMDLDSDYCMLCKGIPWGTQTQTGTMTKAT